MTNNNVCFVTWTFYNVQWMLIYEYLSFLSKGDFHGYTLHLTNISHSQYLNILTWLQDIQDTQDTIAIFLISLFLSLNFPKKFGCEENNTKNTKVCPESLTYVLD